MLTIVPADGTTPVFGGGTTHRVLCKGAAEWVLKDCDSYLDANQQKQPLTDDIREDIMRTIEAFGKKLYRNIGLTYKDIPDAKPINKDAPLDLSDPATRDYYCSNHTFVFLSALQDPLRKEVPKAIQDCARAKIQVRMVTGDNLGTAKAIGEKCGIYQPNRKYINMDPSKGNIGDILPDVTDMALEGPDFRSKVLRKENPKAEEELDIDMEKFDQIWPTLTVVGRCSETDKKILVRGLMRTTCKTVPRPEGTDLKRPVGEVVAVTGDGTNDAPALLEANVGFAMGIAGTDAAKEAADIIVTDDNFASIVKAVKWGRNVYDSVQKFLQFQITVNIAACTVTVIGAAIISQSPLTAIQLLWVNMIMDSFASLALATEEPKDSILDRAPFPKKAAIITESMWRSILGHAVYQFAVLIVFIFFAAGDTPDDGQLLRKGGWFDLYSGWPATDPDMSDQYLCQDSDAKFAKWIFPGTELANLTTSIPDFYEKPEISFVQDCRAHFAMIFNTFVMMQLFNQINARKLSSQGPEWNSFKGILDNSIFLFIMGIEFGGQVIMVQIAGIVFKTDGGLTIEQWLICIALASGELLWNFAVLSVPPSLVPRFLLEFDKKLEPEDDTETLATPAPVTKRSSSLLKVHRADSASKFDLDGKQFGAVSGASRDIPEGTPVAKP